MNLAFTHKKPKPKGKQALPSVDVSSNLNPINCIEAIQILKLKGVTVMVG